MAENTWAKAGQAMVAAGQIPLPVEDTMIKLVKTMMNEEEAEFILSFAKTNPGQKSVESGPDLPPGHRSILEILD